MFETPHVHRQGRSHKILTNTPLVNFFPIEGLRNRDGYILVVCDDQFVVESATRRQICRIGDSQDPSEIFLVATPTPAPRLVAGYFAVWLIPRVNHVLR